MLAPASSYLALPAKVHQLCNILTYSFNEKYAPSWTRHCTRSVRRAGSVPGRPDNRLRLQLCASTIMVLTVCDANELESSAN